MSGHNNVSVESKIIDNLTEGILVVDALGTVEYLNKTAHKILCLPDEGVVGKKFGSLFFNNAENDAFSQTVIDALHSDEKLVERVVPFSAGGNIRHLRMYVAYLPNASDISGGYIIVFSDLSELMELRDIAQDIERVSTMNKQLTLRNELLQKTFGMYFSDEVVQELLDKPEGPNLGGKSEVLTIMMSDLRGFTALSEQMHPENLIRILNHYLGAMTKEIQRYSGTIIEFIGDGIMAIFGAPIHSVTHAANAVAAALSMQAAMEKVNAWNEKMGFPHLEMGIGLNTGEVIIGNVGSKLHMKYGIVGSHVNLCGRIESYTIGGQILISPSVREAVGSPLTIAKELTVAPKGVGHKLLLSQVTGIGEPYNIALHVEKDIPEELSEPVPISFSLVRDKHTESDIHYGGLTAIGRESAILQTDA
ncbi:MAG: adenylate/guanylate cyclase domain-containing protein, partial [Lachnospiraceae bacterium]|nr:adenylate/guanylate cyclase domain-containing protein [Lachnospiraceae bacterium]